MPYDFNGSSGLEVSIGLELQLLDSETLEPSHLGKDLIASVRDNKHIKNDLFGSVIVITFDNYQSLEQLSDELAQLLEMLQVKAKQYDILLLASGTHPTFPYMARRLTQEEKFIEAINRLQWVGKRIATFGQRIQVAVPDGEKAVAVMNSLVTFLPLLLGLSASSPYWQDFDTGLASARVRVVETVPNAGIPPNIVNWSEFLRFVKTLRTTESIRKLSDLWWDIRPNSKKGALQIQICDMPHTLQEIISLTALTKTLVANFLDDYVNGRPLPMLDSWINRENKWRAARFGLDAQLIHTRDGDTIPFYEFFERMVVRIEGTAKRLNTIGLLDNTFKTFERGAPYQRQRLLKTRFGFQHMIETISNELKENKVTELGQFGSDNQIDPNQDSFSPYQNI